MITISAGVSTSKFIVKPLHADRQDRVHVMTEDFMTSIVMGPSEARAFAKQLTDTAVAIDAAAQSVTA